MLSTLPEGEPDFTLGWEAARWAESLLIQPNGPRAGRSFRFTRDQLRFLLWWYAMDDDGSWLFQHGARRLAKGAGKSPFAAVMCLIEFCAPVRLARKDHRAPGGAIGAPVSMPLVQIAATAESQTANTMRMVRAFAPKGSAVVAEHDIDVGKMKFFKLPEGTLEVITSSAVAVEGAESSFVVGDETEHWRPINGGDDLASTLSDNLAKSGSRMLETANAWIPGQQSVAESTWDGWVLEQEGALRGSRGTLYDARMAPPDTDLTDYGSLESALRWVYGDCDWRRGGDGEIDVSPMIERIWSPRASPSESKRKFLNWPSVAEDAWLTPQEWGRLADPSIEVSPSDEIVLFFDGSKSRDATALIACRVSDGHVFVPQTVMGRPTIWEPSNAHNTDDVVPVAEVDAAVDHVMATHNVVAFFADVREWESFAKVRWPEHYSDRLRIMAVPSGKDPQWIAWDMRGKTFDFTQAVELVGAEVAEERFTHDGNSILARHVANARRHPNRYGVSISKESPSSGLKIDAAVAMVGARMVRRLVSTSAKPARSGLVVGLR